MITEIEALLGGDHAQLDELLDSVLASLEAGKVTEAYSQLDLFWARLAMHIRAEHLHLFPAVLKICETAGSEDFSDIPETLEHLRGDHNFFMRELAEAIKSMRADAMESGLDAQRRVESVRDRLAEHNLVEEERIYPLRKFLSPSADEELLRSLTRELDNLPPRFGTDRT